MQDGPSALAPALCGWLEPFPRISYADCGEPVLGTVELPCDHVLDVGVERGVTAEDELGTRLVDMPLYRLGGIDVGKGRIDGSLAIARFASYALTLDLLEGELADALTAGITPEPETLALRDRYLPDAASVLNVGGRFCAGGALAPCAFARLAHPYRDDADYILLVQERSALCQSQAWTAIRWPRFRLMTAGVMKDCSRSCRACGGSGNLVGTG